MDAGQETGDGVIALTVNAGERADIVEPSSSRRQVLIALVNKIGDIAQDGDSRPNASVTSLGVGNRTIKAIMNASQETSSGIIPRTLLADKTPDVMKPGRGTLIVKIILIEQISDITKYANR